MDGEEARRGGQLMPFEKIVASRQEHELAGEIARPRPRRAVKKGLSCATHPLLVGQNEVRRAAVSKFYSVAAHRLDELRPNAASGHRSALDGSRWSDLYVCGAQTVGTAVRAG